MACLLASRGGRRVLATTPAAALAVVALAISTGSTVSQTPSELPTIARSFHPPHASLSSSRLARSTLTWNGGPTVASTGETVNVFVSATLPPEHGTAQTWADFIAGLLHGSELSSLTAYIAPIGEMQSICGEDALGCYGSNRMVSMGEANFGVTAEEVVRHEYGHHIAFNRLNSPWLAVAWGPKNWASTSGVCRRAADGSAYPGDEGDNYRLNPGEAWAETYRLLVERKAGLAGSSWGIVDSSFYPTEAALTAAERDVVRPWASPKTTVSATRFRRQGRRIWALAVATPLDGSVDIRIQVPPGGLHDVVLLRSDRKTVLARGLWASTSTKTIATTVCGDRSLILRITQRGAFGRVKVATRVP
jgi:hypothetical protein